MTFFGDIETLAKHTLLWKYLHFFFEIPKICFLCFSGSGLNIGAMMLLRSYIQGINQGREWRENSIQI